MKRSSAQVKKIETACPGGYLNRKNRPSLCLWGGLVAGGLVALLSEWVGLIPLTGHQLNDPLLITISFARIFRGLTYFNWAGFFLTIGASAVLGIIAWGTLKVFASQSDRTVMAEDVVRSVSIAVWISALPVWIQEVDAVQVLLWYGISTYLSVVIARMAAGFFHKIVS